MSCNTVLSSLRKLWLAPVILLIACQSGSQTDQAKQQTSLIRDYPIKPVAFTRVNITDDFWAPRLETNRKVTIPYNFQKCEETGRIRNFAIAGGLEEGEFEGIFFNDSDVFKVIEGASYSLQVHDDPELKAYLDDLIMKIAAAQEEDGYLYTNRTIDHSKAADGGGEERWTNLKTFHELYNVGHMYEAAVAHYLATESRTFLDVAVKNADLIYDVCITQGNKYVPGHQEIEIGLAKLYRVTGDEKYLQLAKHLLDIRADVHEGSYAQAHLPVTEQSEAVGHAVRANYMYSAMADVAALTGDSAYLEAIGRIWDNVVEKKLSVTGGIGASHRGEAYGENYELPNHPYNETCAAIANVYWNHRMFLLHGDAKYMDVLERSLYNGVISGLSLDGTLFFYPNTLQHDGEAAFNQGVNGRSPWFECSCCPSNLSRFVPSVAGYAFATRGSEVFVNLYMNSQVSLQTEEGVLVLSQQTNYPWDGDIHLEIENEKSVEATVHLRIPGWAMNEPVPSDLFRFEDEPSGNPSLSVNGMPVQFEIEQGYAILHQDWKKGDVISLKLPMEDRIIAANDSVEAKQGLRAVQYGPLIYCAEEIDNQVDVLEAEISESSQFSAKFRPELLGGVNMLEGKDLNLVPYYAWANRGAGKMNVWFNEKIEIQ
ncbi:MAG: glycoside hydrolase family 127 protein [Bacteroidales bacterium]|nr:glycoside hydrolase family 127 protein [Bacteroidales bacterium]